MSFTDHQAKYLAYELTRRHGAGDAGRLTGALADAKVDFNPHQIDTTLFAFRVYRLGPIEALSALMIPGIVYERVNDDQWELTRMRSEGKAGLDRYLGNLYEVANPAKSPYRFVEYDSRVEEQFARALDHNEDVRFFVKLPDWFTVDTPIGTYNPDWAIMLRDGNRLYLVQETKGSLIPEDRRPAENVKIACAKKHFTAIDVEYGVITDLHQTLSRIGGGSR